MAGISFFDADGLRVSESGTSATFRVVLDTAPASNVTLEFKSSDASEGAVSPVSVVFTPQTWDTPRDVKVTGVDDDVIDDDVAFEIRTTVIGGGAEYSSLTPGAVNVTNVDDDVADIVSSATGPVETHELAIPATFTLALSARPTADVTLLLSSSDPSEGVPSPNELVFPRNQWNVPQEVTVTGIPEAGLDGGVAYEVRGSFESSDSDFANALVTPVAVFNKDFEVRRLSAADSSAGGARASSNGEHIGFMTITPKAGVWVYDVANQTRTVQFDNFTRFGTYEVTADGTLIIVEGAELLEADANSDSSLFAVGRDKTVTSLLPTESNGGPFNLSVTPDGNWIAFDSDSDNLVSGDTNGKDDVFVLDRSSGNIQRVSLTSVGAQIPNGATEASISSDGCRVAFYSTGAVVPGVSEGQRVYVRDRCTPTTMHASENGFGSVFAGDNAAINSAGTHVAYTYDKGFDDYSQVAVKNLETGALVVASSISGLEYGDGDSNYADISGDGRYVAYRTRAPNLRAPGGPASGQEEVCVSDVQQSRTRCVPTELGARPAEGSVDPNITEDGRYLIFSGSSEVAAGAATGIYGVYMMELGDAFWNSPLIFEAN